MRRLLLLACCVCACSFQKEGTASDVELNTARPDTAVADTLIASDTSSALDTTVVDVAFEDSEVAPPPDAPTDVGKCPAGKAGLTPCTSVPAFEPLATTQVMDGKAEDFCDVPFVDFDMSKGMLKNPDPIPGGAAATMKIRVAWSSYGLHAHFAIKDDKPFVYGGVDGLLYQGDSVEIYMAGTDALTGSYDGLTLDRGAQQLVIAPPQGTLPTRASYFYNGVFRGGAPADRWAARTVPGGYEVEVRVPFADLAATGATAGRKIALTFAFNNKYDASKAQAFSTFQVKAAPSTSTCGTSVVQAVCDDRIWCTPTLAP